MLTLLRAEGAFLALVALILFHLSGGNWWWFAALILAPDLSMLGYLGGPVIGARCYNAVHTWIAPVVLYLAALILGLPVLTLAALVLAAHIGIDRAFGFGLKRTSGFRDTHLN